MASSAKRQRKDREKEEARRIALLKPAPSHNHNQVLTDDGQINISQSKVKTWRECRRMYHWKFVLGIQKKLRKRPFMFGGIVHEIVEAEAEGKKWQKVLGKIELDNKKLFKKEIEMYGNIILDIQDIMTDYFEYWNEGAGSPNRLKPIEHDGRHSEHEFRIELFDGIWFTGKIDVLAKAKKMRWLGEHKTFSRMPSEDDRWRSIQTAVYFRATEVMGLKPFDGVLWDYVSSKAPNVPGELTPTGRISQRKLDTVPSRVRRWMKDEGIKKTEYPKLLSDAYENLPNRFIRLFSPVKPAVVNVIWDEFLETAQEIADNHGKKKAMCIGRHCTWCDYNPLCKAEMLGDDVEWLLERDYQLEDQSHKRDQVDRVED